MAWSNGVCLTPGHSCDDSYRAPALCQALFHTVGCSTDKSCHSGGGSLPPQLCPWHQPLPSSVLLGQWLPSRQPGRPHPALVRGPECLWLQAHRAPWAPGLTSPTSCYLSIYLSIARSRPSMTLACSCLSLCPAAGWPCSSPCLPPWASGAFTWHH